MTMARSRRDSESNESPEARIYPYEDLDTKQSKITGEKFPALGISLCDECKWGCTLLNEKGAITFCPLCNSRISRIPMRIDEVCIVEQSKEHGLVISFDRALPLR